VKWPESIITAAICVVAEILDYTTSKNVSEETLLRALERLLLASPLPRVNPKRKLRAKKDLLEELVRKGYLTLHGGRKTYMLTRTGLSKALKECLSKN